MTTLTFKLEREVKPTEIAYLALGTGVGSYPWWDRINISLFVGSRYDTIADPFVNTNEHCVLIVRYDDPESAEGSGVQRTKVLTLQQVVDATTQAWGHLAAEAQRDMTEDLGLADAEAADVVLQFAVFGEIVYG